MCTEDSGCFQQVVRIYFLIAMGNTCSSCQMEVSFGMQIQTGQKLTVSKTWQRSRGKQNGKLRCSGASRTVHSD